MTNLPVRGQTGSLDDTAVTREQFRQGIGSFLEYVAQALGNVNGAYGAQAIDPANPTLASSGTTTNGAKLQASPPAGSNDLRIPTTAWVKSNAAPVTTANSMRFKGGASAVNIGVCWGDAAYPGSLVTVTFPFSFTSVPAVVLQADYGPGNGLWLGMKANPTVSSFNAYVIQHGVGGSSVIREDLPASFSWIAIGPVA